MKRAGVGACGLVLLACLLPASTKAAQPQAETVDIAADAYIYGYPLVLMEFTRAQGPAVWGLPVNTFHHDRELKGPANTAIVRTNNDNLYSSAFVDLTAQPIVLHVPDTTGRYYLMQMLDAWTNTFANPGTRTTGSKAGDFILVGPGWNGSLPESLTVFRAPTNKVWIIGRTQVRGTPDLPAVWVIQDQYLLTPLSDWLAGKAAPVVTPSPGKNSDLTPPQQVAALSGVQFLQTLSRLMKESPAAAADKPALERLATIGFVPGEEFNPPEAIQEAVNAAVPIAYQRISAQAKAFGETINGWNVILTELGTFGTDYLKRAAVAASGLGANLREDAVYHSARTDGNGQPLTGARSYKLHFEPGQTPPTHAFWSITLYDEHGYLFANPENRYAIHDTDPLQYNPDRSLDIYLQTDPPSDPALRANWLPAPAGLFNLAMRIYWPDEAVLNEEWVPPPVLPAP